MFMSDIIEELKLGAYIAVNCYNDLPLSISHNVSSSHSDIRMWTQSRFESRSMQEAYGEV